MGVVNRTPGLILGVNVIGFDRGLTPRNRVVAVLVDKTEVVVRVLAGNVIKGYQGPC